MFFKPTTVASMVAALSSEAHEAFKEFYSDYHKDAIGCRPRKPAPECPVAAAVEDKRLQEWMLEDQRIEAMAYEVARYRFSRSMEYLQRRGDATSAKDAFRQVIERSDRYFFKGDHRDWDGLCYDLGLPFSDAAQLKEFWEAE